jgi:hypothetical protein
MPDVFAQLHDGQEIVIEPFARRVSDYQDLVCDRKALTASAGGRFYQRADRRRRTRAPSCAEGHLRPRDGRRAMHRLRGVRGRVCDASAMLFVAAKSRTSTCCTRTARRTP